MIKVVGLSKEYSVRKGKVTAIDNISFEIADNEFVAIIGKSGCGKSTLLNAISGLTTATRGSIYVDDLMIGNLSKKKLAEYRRDKVGIILQDAALLNNLTVYQNIELPLKIRKMAREKRRDRIIQILERLDITEIEEKFPGQLSGGQKQRVAIARAIIYKPAIILADEPTEALDDDNAFNILNIFKDLSKDTTILMVTHNREIAYHCNRVITIDNGKIVRDEKCE